MLSISLIEGDVLERPSDLLILKFAGAFHGVDQAVSQRIGYSDGVADGDFAVVAGRRIKAARVLFLGVGDLFDFRYAQIRKFGYDVLKIAGRLDNPPEKITMPIHGPGYGLDEKEAFLSLVAGLMQAIKAGELPENLKTLEIVERDEKRVARLRRLLAGVLEGQPAQVLRRGSLSVMTGSDRLTSASASPSLDVKKAANDLARYGAASERKTRLFVAMPFKDEYIDEYDIAITEAAQHANLVCERIDKEAYVGDVMKQVKERIASYHGMLALLNDANPNVFLEVGYAWAKDKPTVLIAKKGQALPFDVTNQKCILYTNISDLRTKLKAELKGLVDNGILSASH